MGFDFDREKFIDYFLTGEDALPLPSLHTFEVLPSTNVRLWELLDRGIPLPAVAIAARQTAGRGQWGRTWQSPPGGLYLSLAIAPQLAIADSFHLTLCTATGIAARLRETAIPVALKWPNDLLLAGRKLGGIKIETRLREGKIALAVIGVGINWRNCVPEPGINLQDFAAIDSLEHLAAIATVGILSAWERYRDRGVAPWLAQYNRWLDSIGRKVLVDGCPAVVVAVEASGELRLRSQTPGAPREFFRKPGTIGLGYEL